MFETSGKLDESFLIEAWWPLLGQRNKRSLALSLGFLLLLAVIFLALGEYVFLAVTAGLLLLYLGSVYRGILRQRKQRLDRLQEAFGARETNITTGFDELGVYECNRETGGTSVLPYEVIASLEETPRYLLLVSKSGQAAVVFKNSPLDKAALIAHLKSKPTAIKWRK